MSSEDNKILAFLIDSDGVFRETLKQKAKSRHIGLDTYSELVEMGRIGSISKYHVAILDYQLGSLSGVEISEYLHAFFKGKPTILISATDDIPIIKNGIPEHIYKFVLKTEGLDKILDAVEEAAKGQLGVSSSSHAEKTISPRG